MFEKMDLGELGKVFEEIQEKAKRLQEEQEKKIFTAKSGGGMVKVSANGKGEVIDIDIDDSLLEDKESLEILLLSAINDVYKMVEEDKQKSAMGLINPFGTK
ncbi:MAG: nucleoid-associated protein, YbaB/EbfC family [Epsilonproteobacteria bacterium]|nr:nucleoid-associated protein, YbaB/EbfC family [Campylobacterota bacterium]NPA64689.1 YbaB/EbfC family nucleoid-associated protein [Campylobacterota bacterium]